MSDTKNILLAWVSAGTTLLTNVSDGLIPLVSAVVLPIIFFAVGKTVDVLLQLYLRRDRGKDATRSERARPFSEPETIEERGQ